MFTSSHPDVFLGKGVLKIWSKFTGEHPYWSVISIKLQSKFIVITLQHGCSPVNLLHIFRTRFLKNTSWRLLVHFVLQDQSEDYIGEDDIIDMVEVIVYKLRVSYIVFIELHHRKYSENCFFYSLWIFILKITKTHFNKNQAVNKD